MLAGFQIASAHGAPKGAELLIDEVAPQSGLSASSLGHKLVKAGGAHNMALRYRRSHTTLTPPKGLPCLNGTEVNGGLLVASLPAPLVLQLRWIAPFGCEAAEVEIAWDRNRPRQTVELALARLQKALLAKPEHMIDESETWESVGSKPSPSWASSRSSGVEQTVYQESIEALETAEPRLARAVRSRLGLRWRKKANGTDGYIDGPNFVRQVYMDAYGVDLSADIEKLLVAGGTVEFDLRAPEKALRPGDLLFITSYSGIPRSVMVYIGGGYRAHSTKVMGVVVEAVPRKIPNYIYLVAVRPD